MLKIEHWFLKVGIIRIIRMFLDSDVSAVKEITFLLLVTTYKDMFNINR